uniref:Ribosomal protein S3 n=2 Tax=Emericellopsis TaxID=45244 RepID=A0A141IQG3_9HYPO|nr:ribosomal protein S3 [Emericellopsis fuci]ALP86449.1 ribosomal protein S3 [Emericellopsis sp. 1a5]ALP86464.1 ribosomal protein S3 [Emericellopsis fuci]
MKIFNNNLKKIIRTPRTNTKLGVINNNKYLPAFSSEWKNIIYSFNRNNLRNMGWNTINLNKIIQSYFNLFFKSRIFLGKTKFLYLKRRRNLLKRIFVSDADVKYTANKANITLYTVNKEKKSLRNKYMKLKTLITTRLFKRYAFFYKYYQNKLNSCFHQCKRPFWISKFMDPKELTKNKFIQLRWFLMLNNLILKKIWSILIKRNLNKYWSYLRKHELSFSLNQFKFNKSIMLSKLAYLLERILGKKVHFNIINLKSISYHPDIFTQVITLKAKKNLLSIAPIMSRIINKTMLPVDSKVQDKSKVQGFDKLDIFKNKYKDLKIISHINKNNFSVLLNTIFGASLINTETMHKKIFHSIGYKNLYGIRLKASGRLTRRYRADRAKQFLNWKGGLKNIDSSFKQLSAVTFRGNSNANVRYSLNTSKRRIGSFAVKGWISAK